MSKEISVIGIGKLGLCLALNLERVGYTVDGVDLNQAYIDKLSLREFTSSEPYVTQYVNEAKNIYYTTNIEYGLQNDTIFVVVGTPSTKDWKYDHKYIEMIVDKIIANGKASSRKDLIINCTVFPGYCDELQERLKPYNYYVSYNPEFIAQGSIMMDQINPDMVLIGEADSYAKRKIKEIYNNLTQGRLEDHQFKTMTPLEAEIAKISLNCFLTTKIAYANMVGDISIRSKCRPEVILDAIGQDSRIGHKYLKYGFGYGGPCFPRDNRALNRYAEEVGMKAIIAQTTDKSNHQHLHNQVLEHISKDPNKEKEVEIDFVTFNEKSTSLEESQQLQYALMLKRLGYKIKVKDKRPEVLKQLKGIL